MILSYHRGQAPCWSIAASTVYSHRFIAVRRPMLSALSSFSVVRAHFCLGQPRGRLQWHSNPKITVCSALELHQ